MVDELFDRSYQAARAELNTGVNRGLTRLARTVNDSFKVLHRIEWGAPWAANSKNR